jgi:hypothetical protein
MRREFERQIRADLGLERRVGILDTVELELGETAIELMMETGLPPISLNVGKLAEWFMQRIWKRRLVVLTDLARARTFSELDDMHLRTFVEKSTGQRFAGGATATALSSSLRR